MRLRGLWEPMREQVDGGRQQGFAPGDRAAADRRLRRELLAC